MKTSTFLAAVTAFAGTAAAESMAKLRELKIDTWARQHEAGAYDIDRYQATAATSCVNGKAGEYQCSNVDLKGFLRHQDMGSSTRKGNDIWGWTAPNGREFATVGQTDGTAFVELLSDGSLVYLGRLPTQTTSSSWRDMKVIGNHVYIGSEASNHGLQVFDLTKLLDIDPSSPKVFSTTSDLTAIYKGFGSSHNIVAHEETNMIYAVGTAASAGCRGGLFMVNVTNPASPVKAGCLSAGGYVHDAQCVIYKGPDTRYTGKEICFNFNEDTLDIVDVTSKSSPKTLSSKTYNGASYTHQGWLLDSSMKYLLLDDELDEYYGNGKASNKKTTTYIVDISSLTAPTFSGIYQSPATSIDHNQYVVKGLSYQSNYGSGLRIVDVSSIPSKPDGSGLKQVGFFDCYPEDDSYGGRAEFTGSWSVYPFFKSGYVLLNSIERGVFSLKYTGAGAAFASE
ncbi:hypothetical protein GE21DRAFT_2745 [Neurospora crassa]|uniref:Regulatory P domain-containing protein n=2 Tax=Neurospora crassa TaxID=5141 RepID=Q1K4P4_NEUCR|nr:hypothetical protein NCU03512 [Neurospora crassa OR74A]EAA26632.1 hypothetical protein NCU03512 [Neurospora crassa OR74A]KHE82243.1 hypothetical protein GE21DRAFT_2745 [Neurospora crassa]CAC09402.2 hypothetical protein [Neurospora crassa]|eukprot:XP_955868.1 hypothetical protein NCU03512 [Neurospora crassa OR74A]